MPSPHHTGSRSGLLVLARLDDRCARVYRWGATATDARGKREFGKLSALVRSIGHAPSSAAVARSATRPLHLSLSLGVSEQAGAAECVVTHTHHHHPTQTHVCVCVQLSFPADPWLCPSPLTICPTPVPSTRQVSKHASANGHVHASAPRCTARSAPLRLSCSFLSPLETSFPPFYMCPVPPFGLPLACVGPSSYISLPFFSWFFVPTLCCCAALPCIAVLAPAPPLSPRLHSRPPSLPPPVAAT